MSYAALGIEERYLDEIKEAMQDRLQDALADMSRCNMESITNRAWSGGDVNQWLLTGPSSDPVLVQRFEALGRMPERALGHAFLGPLQAEQLRFPWRSKSPERRLLRYSLIPFTS